MTDRVAEALRLRAWAIRVLAEGWTAAPDVGPEAWRLFLRAERCALALSTRAEGDAPPLLHATATVELQRILSARAQLERLGRAAARAGLRALVLKGGVAALGTGAPVDLHDVDVLAEPGQAEALADLLDRSGYAVAGGRASAHLGQRVTANAVDVEVHFRVEELGDPADLWARAEPLPQHPGLWQPAPFDHCRHVLLHATITHPFRRGALRDLLLIGEADRACPPAGAAHLGDFLRDHPQRLLLEAARDAARALQAGRRERDAFVEEAAAHYLLSDRYLLAAAAPIFGGNVMFAVYARLGRPAVRRGYWGRAWRGATAVSPWPALNRLERHWPRAGRWARRLLRLARAPLVELVAGPIARRARRLATGQAGAASAATSRSGAP